IFFRSSFFSLMRVVTPIKAGQLQGTAATPIIFCDPLYLIFRLFSTPNWKQGCGSQQCGGQRAEQGRSSLYRGKRRQRGRGKPEKQCGEQGGERAVQQFGGGKAIHRQFRRRGDCAHLELHRQPTEAQKEGSERQQRARGQGQEGEPIQAVGQFDHTRECCAVRHARQYGRGQLQQDGEYGQEG